MSLVHPTIAFFSMVYTEERWGGGYDDPGLVNNNLGKEYPTVVGVISYFMPLPLIKVPSLLLVPHKCSDQSASRKGYQAFLIGQQLIYNTHDHACTLEFLIRCRKYNRWYLVTVKLTNQH